MPSFRYRRLCGPLVLFCLCYFVCLSSAGISKTSGAPLSNGIKHPFPDSSNSAEGRSASSHHGRTLIFKSLILVPLAMVILILFFLALLPIPVISVPPGRSLSSSTFPAIQRLAKDVLTSEECVERIACVLASTSRSYDSTSWIPSTLERFFTRGKWSDKVLRGLNKGTYEDCLSYTCSPAKTIKRAFKLE